MASLIITPALADQTPVLRISSVDSLTPTTKFVGLHGYTNAACDGNRLLLEDADPEYRKQMFSIVLGAYFAGKPVLMVFTVSGGNCRVSRVITYDQ